MDGVVKRVAKGGVSKETPLFENPGHHPPRRRAAEGHWHLYLAMSEIKWTQLAQFYVWNLKVKAPLAERALEEG